VIARVDPHAIEQLYAACARHCLIIGLQVGSAGEPAMRPREPSMPLVQRNR
jgi:hypothetical protein